MVKSTQAKTKINQWFKQELKEENIIKGKNAIDDYCKSKSIPISDLMKPEFMKATLKRYNFADWDSLMAAVGHGGLKEGQIVNRLLEEFRRTKEKNQTDEDVVKEINSQHHDFQNPKGSVLIKGAEGMSVHFSKCCTPVPGDEIVGFITRGRGITIHRTDCENLLAMTEVERRRLIDAEWIVGENSESAEFTTEINIYAMDRSALIFDITKVFMETDIPIKRIEGRLNKQGKSTVNVQFGIKSKDDLGKLMSKLRNIQGIVDIQRTQG